MHKGICKKKVHEKILKNERQIPNNSLPMINSRTLSLEKSEKRKEKIFYLYENLIPGIVTCTFYNFYVNIIKKIEQRISFTSGIHG